MGWQGSYLRTFLGDHWCLKPADSWSCARTRSQARMGKPCSVCMLCASATAVMANHPPSTPVLMPAEQFWSTEALGMGIFYTLNVFIMQFYLGGCWHHCSCMMFTWGHLCVLKSDFCWCAKHCTLTSRAGLVILLGQGVYNAQPVFCQLCDALPLLPGTTRLQLENKGDAGHQYTDFANIIVAFAFLGIPIIGWLLDKKVHTISCGPSDATPIP